MPHRRWAYPCNQFDGAFAILGIREAYLVKCEAYLGNDESLTLVTDGPVGRLRLGKDAVHVNRKRFAVESKSEAWGWGKGVWGKGVREVLGFEF